MRRTYRTEKRTIGLVVCGALAVTLTTTLWQSVRRDAAASRAHREAAAILKSADELFASGKYFDARVKYADAITHASVANTGGSLGAVETSAIVGTIKCNAFIGGDAGVVAQINKLRELGIRLDPTKEADGLPKWLEDHACRNAAALLQDSVK